jgi:hypothetical protein
MVAWLAAGWCAYRALAERARRRLDPVLLVPIASLAVVVGAIDAVTAATFRPRPDPVQTAVVHLADVALGEARGAHGPVLLRSRLDVNLPIGGRGAGLPSLALELERHRVAIVVDRDAEIRYGAFRAHPERAVEELVLTSPGTPVPDGAHVVATVDPLTRAQRAERTTLTAQLYQTLPNATLAQLRERMRRDAVFRRRVARVNAIPDLPVLQLVGRPLR